MPTLPSSFVVNSGVWPNSVMFASTGTSTVETTRWYIDQVGHRLGKNRVGARFDEGRHALQHGVETVDGERVGPRHYDEVRVESSRRPQP